MENARALNERLRQIIKEVSSDTGSEIKKDLQDELATRIETIIKEQSDLQVRNTLQALRRALKNV